MKSSFFKNLLAGLKEIPHIYLVFACFVMLFVGYIITRNDRVFDLANTALGGVMGLAMRQKSEQSAIPLPEGFDATITSPPGTAAKS